MIAKRKEKWKNGFCQKNFTKSRLGTRTRTSTDDDVVMMKVRKSKTLNRQESVLYIGNKAGVKMKLVWNISRGKEGNAFMDLRSISWHI